MKTLVVYSSRTGNTKKVGEAIAAVLPSCDIFAVEDAPSVEGYDFVAVGYWVDKGIADAKCKAYIESISHARVGLFGTLGAYPDSDHAKDCVVQSEALFMEPARGNTVLGSFICQGKVDPKITEMMNKMSNNPHPMTPERQARLEEAAKHPNEEDCAKAQDVFKAFIAQITV